MPTDPRVGITTTIPIEPLMAAGLTPVDLNNLFVTSHDPGALVALAEAEGFPRNSCSWIKGMFGAAVENGITAMVDLASGDCDAGRVLSEILSTRGLKLYRFAFPLNYAAGEHRIAETRLQIESLCSQLGVTVAAAERVFEELKGARLAALELDRKTATSRFTGPGLAGGSTVLAGGSTVYKQLISTSDFEGDPARHELVSRQILKAFEEAGEGPGGPGGGPAGAGTSMAPGTGSIEPVAGPLRIGIVGIPPIFSDLFEVIEGYGGLVLYHEVPHQFALPAVGLGAGMVEAYADYSYPKTVAARAEVIKRECSERQIDVLIHNVQTFCHRQIEDPLMKNYLPWPVLTLEGDRPGPVDARTRLRLEAFITGRRRAK